MGRGASKAVQKIISNNAANRQGGLFAMGAKQRNAIDMVRNRNQRLATKDEWGAMQQANRQARQNIGGEVGARVRQLQNGDLTGRQARQVRREIDDYKAAGAHYAEQGRGLREAAPNVNYSAREKGAAILDAGKDYFWTGATGAQRAARIGAVGAGIVGTNMIADSLNNRY